MKILFITSTRIGDAVLSTGLLDHLVRTYPDAKVTVACGPHASPLFAAAPNLERVLPMRGSTQPATTATSLSMLRTPAFLKRQSMLGAARPGLSSARRGTNVSADRVWRYLRSWSTGSSRPGTVAGPARAPPAAALAAKAGAARPASMTPSAATAAATASATSDVTDDHLGSLLVSLGRDGGPWTRSARRD